MRKSSNAVAALVLTFAACVTSVRAADQSVPSASPIPHLYVGLQGLALAGVHRDISGSQYGLGVGPLAQVRGGGSRFAIALEGLPVVSIPGTRPSVAYGQATPKLGILNVAAEYALDSQGRVWFGLGQTVYNQRTPLPALQQEVSSRLSGLRYVARVREPLAHGRFVEAVFGGTPVLTGADHFLTSNGAPAVNKPEQASEIDASIGLGWRRGSSEWVVGLRTLNFAARFTVTGEAADRNVGIGALLEWRHLLRP